MAATRRTRGNSSRRPSPAKPRDRRLIWSWRGCDGKFAAAQVSGITDVLVAARRLTPQLPAVYELLADTWLHRAEKMTTPEATALVDALRQFPGRMRLAYQIGALALDANMADLARSMAEHGLT